MPKWVRKLAGTDSLYTDKKQDEEGIRRREDFYKMKNYEDKIYSLGEIVTGRHRPCHRPYRKHWKIMAGVGIMTGSYDQKPVYFVGG